MTMLIFWDNMHCLYASNLHCFSYAGGRLKATPQWEAQPMQSWVAPWYGDDDDGGDNDDDGGGDNDDDDGDGDLHMGSATNAILGCIMIWSEDKTNK